MTSSSISFVDCIGGKCINITLINCPCLRTHWFECTQISSPSQCMLYGFGKCQQNRVKHGFNTRLVDLYYTCVSPFYLYNHTLYVDGNTWRPPQLSTAFRQDYNLPGQRGYPQLGGAAEVRIITTKRGKPVYPQPTEKSLTCRLCTFLGQVLCLIYFDGWTFNSSVEPNNCIWTLCGTSLTSDRLHHLLCSKYSMS